MPGGRPRINLDSYQLELIGLFAEGLSYDQLLAYLAEDHNIRISLRTIKGRFKSWGVTRRLPTEVEERIKNRIQVLFFEVGLEDNEILTVLQEEGTPIGRYTLIRLRFDLGLRRRIRGVEQQQEADRTVERLVALELQKGIIDGYGRGYLYTHFRQKQYVIARDRLFKAYRTINPEAVERRHRDLQRHNGEYIVPGPNFIWSIDGHLKLAPYGIEIYACIDAYSRYVVWIYAGVSACTAVSVLRQYLDCLEEVEVQPRFVRSDRGGETVRLADAHHQLSSYGEDLPFEDCYIYGTSTANQRIEAWWLQLTKGLLYRWRVYLKNLQTQGQFSKDRLADRIAIYALFIPMIREQLYSFVRVWNSHKIGKQKNRPHAATGKPYMMYNHPGPGIQNWGVAFDPDRLRTIKEDTAGWNIDAYLPEETLAWCNTILQSIGFDPKVAVLESAEDRTAPFHTVYLELRRQVQDHIDSGCQPKLSLLQTPTGASQWQPNARPEAVRAADLHTDFEAEDPIDPALLA